MVNTSSSLNVSDLQNTQDVIRSIWLRGSLSMAMGFVCIGSVVGNLLVFISLIRERPLPNLAIQMIFRHLSFANLLLAAIGDPFVIVSLACGYWVWGDSARLFEAFWVTFFGLLSMMILALISFEQYSRFVMQRQLNSKQTMMFIIGIYMMALFLGLAPLCGWCSYGPEGYGVSNSLNWTELDDNAASYIVFVMIVGYFFPLVVIVHCYRAIYNLVQVQLNVAVVQTLISSNVTTLTANRNHSLLVQERQLAMTITFIILAFFFSWTPYVVMNLINMFTPYVTQYKILGTVPALFAKSSTLWWILIYGLVDQRIKEACKRTCSHIKRSVRVWYFS